MQKIKKEYRIGDDDPVAVIEKKITEKACKKSAKPKKKSKKKRKKKPNENDDDDSDEDSDEEEDNDEGDECRKKKKEFNKYIKLRRNAPELKTEILEVKKKSYEDYRKEAIDSILNNFAREFLEQEEGDTNDPQQGIKDILLDLQKKEEKNKLEIKPVDEEKAQYVNIKLVPLSKETLDEVDGAQKESSLEWLYKAKRYSNISEDGTDKNLELELIDNKLKTKYDKFLNKEKEILNTMKGKNPLAKEKEEVINQAIDNVKKLYVNDKQAFLNAKLGSLEESGTLEALYKEMENSRKQTVP